MARVELMNAETAPLLVRRLFAGGDPGPITAALANVPELAAPTLGLVNSVYGPTCLPERLKEIVVLRVSAANGCSYCVETHSRVARRMGLREAEVAVLRCESELAGAEWTAREIAALHFSDAISNSPAGAVDCLRGEFNDSEIVELVLVAATTIFLNRFATSLELPA